MSESASDPYASHAAFVPDTPVIWTASEGQVDNLGYYAVCLAFCWLLFPLAAILVRYLRTAFHCYELTPQRLKERTGILSRQTEELELYRVKDIAVEQPAMQRVFGRGRVVLQTSDRSTPRSPSTAFARRARWHACCANTWRSAACSRACARSTEGRHMVRSTLTALALVVLTGHAIAADERDLENRLTGQVQANTGGKVRPDAISKTPVPGVFEVRAGLDIFYVDATGQYAFVEGHLLDLKANRDLTRERLEAAARIDFGSLPLDLALKTVRGNGKRRLAVFEDPSCPYCRALHTLLSQLDDVTIYTFPYPVLTADSDAKARAALCAPDRAKAWSELMSTGKATSRAKPCQSGVDQLIELGTRLSIRGTPTVFFADGRRAQGAVPPDQFMAMLLQAQPRER